MDLFPSIPAGNYGRKRRWPEFVLLGLTLAIAAGAQIAAVHRGHEWGDDFALYILHARNVVEGRPYADTGYIYNPQTAIVGPPTYPPLTPWLLAPVYAVAGLDFVALKGVMVACNLLELGFVALVFRRELRLRARVALLALLGLNHFTLHSVDAVLSEPPFEMLLYLDLWIIGMAETTIIEAGHFGRRLALFVAAGVVAYLAYAARTAGIVLAPALLLGGLLRAGREPWTRYRWTPVLTGLAVFAILAVLQGMWLSSPRHYGNLFAQVPFRPLPQAADYLARWSVFWSNGYVKLAALPLFAAWMVLFVAGFIDCLRRGPATRDVFFVLYLLAVCAWPCFDGERLLAPIFPLWLFYGLRGLDQPWLAARAGVRRAVVGLLVAACAATYAASLTRYPWRGKPEGIAHPQAHQLFEFVRTQTDPQAVVVFVKPRAMALLGQRPSLCYAMPAADEQLWGDLQRMGATHVVVVQRDATMAGAAQPGQLPYLRRFVERNRDRLREVFANTDFSVWQIR